MKGQMQKVYAEMAHTMYCLYLVGYARAKKGEPTMTFKKFCVYAKKLHNEGKVLHKKHMRTGNV